MNKKDEFDEAFDEFGADKADDVIDDDKAADSDDDDKAKEDVVTDEGATDDDSKKEDYEQKWKSLQGIYNKEKKQREELEARIAELEKGPKKEEKVTETIPDEDSELEEYQKEYGYISKNEAKLRAKELAEVRKELEALKQTYESMTPTLNTAQELAALNHVTSIQNAHPDLPKYTESGELLDWINEQPDYLKQPYMAVYEKGKTQQVIDLVTRFKKEKGYVAEGDDESRTLKKKNLAVKVKTGPTRAGASSKAEDFDSAFEEFAK